VLVSGRAESTQSTINQISFHVESLAQLKEIAKRGREAGSASILPLNHGNALSVYIQDPEGNTIEVYADTPWYVHQPFAKPLDLSLPDEEIMRLTEAMVRAEPSFLTREDWMRRTAESLRRRIEARRN
jgi:catechol 2,3-dioxygenase